MVITPPVILFKQKLAPNYASFFRINIVLLDLQLLPNINYVNSMRYVKIF